MSKIYKVFSPYLLHFIYISIIAVVIMVFMRNVNELVEIINKKNIEISNIKQIMNRNDMQHEVIIKMEGKMIKNVEISSLSGVASRLKEIVLLGPKMIFRFQETDCATCIDSYLLLLKSLADSIGEENIIILSRYENLQYLRILIKKHQLNLKAYNYSDILLSPIETCDLEHKAIIFRLNKDLTVDKLHFASSSESIENAYFSDIINKFRCN